MIFQETDREVHIEKLDFLNQYDIALVCGLYKSGTSLTTTLLEEYNGFFNPANIHSKHNKGLGRDGEAYLTKECDILFRINHSLVRDSHFQLNYRQPIKAYLQDWAKPFVIKDPRLVFTLPYWLEVIKELGMKAVVLFTDRQKEELMKSWQKAPFTSSLLKTNPASMDIMLHQQGIQMEMCQSSAVPHICLKFEELKRLKSQL
jgi:hypothetical protein